MKIWSVLVAFALAGCTGASSTGITEKPCPTDSTLTYASFGQSFIQDNCLECHAHERPILSTQAQVKANASSILEEAVYTDAMPEKGSMSLAEREMLGEWLSCGAP
ncbi:MAG: hypothetical protein HOV81_36140 [Kofleriaceae bacterium]|nr:hypothetical protein [Kofleriaceae bacterium]